MASWSATSPDLRKLGPRIDVKIKSSSALLSSLKTPEEVAKYNKVFSATMLVDTGASCSVIDKEVAKFLGLITHGEGTALGPSDTETKHETYDVDMHFLNSSHIVTNLRVMEGTFKIRQGHDGLLGRDILEKATLIYQGEANQYSITF
jgi:predicted aspartyl protease